MPERRCRGTGPSAKIDRTAVEPKQVSGSGCGVATAAAQALTLLLWGAGVELAVAQDGDGEGIKLLVGGYWCNLDLTNTSSSINIMVLITNQISK